MKKTILIISTDFRFVRLFFAPQINSLSKKYNVIVLSKGKISNISKEENIQIEISRKPSIFSDIRALLIIISVIYRRKPNLVLSLMPKAGLLAQLASFLLQSPHRVHIFTGQVWATKTGLARWILRSFDRLISSLASQILTDSYSQMEYLVGNRIVDSKKVSVIGNGSICGVDIKRFSPDEMLKRDFRSRNLIKENEVVFLFLGRLCKEKGIGLFIELAKQLREENCLFLIAGQDEEMWVEVIDQAKSTGANIRYLGHLSDSSMIVKSSDVLVLPSFREGFGSVVIEAGACGLPVIGSDIYGLKDSIIDGLTGLKFDNNDIESLVKCSRVLLLDPELRYSIGMNGRKRAIESFSSVFVQEKWTEYFDDLLS